MLPPCRRHFGLLYVEQLDEAHDPHLSKFGMLAGRSSSFFRARRRKSVRCRTYSNVMHTSNHALTSLCCIADECHDLETRQPSQAEEAIWRHLLHQAFHFALIPVHQSGPMSTGAHRAEIGHSSLLRHDHDSMFHRLFRGLACGLPCYIRIS